MEKAPRKERTLRGERQTRRTGTDRQIGRAERERGGEEGQSPRSKGRKRGRETCAERGKDTKEEERREADRKCLCRKRRGSPRSPDPAPGPSPSPAGGVRAPIEGEGEKITARKAGTQGQTGQTGQERSGPKKAEEDVGGPSQSLQKEGRKRSMQPCAESRIDIRRARDRPDVKRRRSKEEENGTERKRQVSSSLPSYASSSSPSTSNCARTRNAVSFSSLYTVGALLGEGGCGSVYAGTRQADGKLVAIKYVTTNYSKKLLKIPGQPQPLPLEVALMELACRAPACPHVIQLLAWFQEAGRLILVLELPAPCLDLAKFTRQLGGHLEESLARFVLRQAVRASVHCLDRGVLHRDIKPRNLLIQTQDLNVKLIDFGCGDLLKEAPYTHFAGTRLYQPPEWVQGGEYHGRPATVWSIGVLLFTLVCGRLPFSRELDVIGAELHFRDGLSDDCKNLIRWCLRKDPYERPDLEQILQHQWMTR